MSDYEIIKEDTLKIITARQDVNDLLSKYNNLESTEYNVGRIDLVIGLLNKLKDDLYLNLQFVHYDLKS